MTAKHTPGPWAVISGEVCAAGYGAIAHCDRDNRNTKPVERDANARLIAAAPDLLEALKVAEYIIQRQQDNAGNYTYPQILEQARAAIAKAEGI